MRGRIDLDYILLIIGFIFLIKGATYFVDGSSSIARRFGLSPMLIGLTIVAFGTSSPEGAVSIRAAIRGSNEIVVGNIIGSSLFNIILVIGVVAAIKQIKLKHKTIIKELPFLLLTSVVLLVISLDSYLQQQSNTISRSDGLILVSFFLIFLYYIIEAALTSKEKIKEDVVTMPLQKSILIALGGVTGILLGANWVVNSSTNIALKLGMSETLAGLTIVAVGTSLPELTTSIVAALKGESDIAIGNVIGSNVFNILLVLGITTIIKPIPVDSKVLFDMIYLLLATIIVFFFSVTKKTITRIEGSLLVIAYIGYMVYIIIRN